MSIKQTIKARVRFVCNTSNMILIFPDLRNPVDEMGFSMQPGDKIDLKQFYTAREINRSRSVDAFCRMKNTGTGKFFLTVFKTQEELDAFKYEPIQPLMRTSAGAAGLQYQGPPNFADDNLLKLQKDEDAQNEKASAFAKPSATPMYPKLPGT